MGHKTIFTSEKGEKLVKNKDKPWWKRLLAKITALVAAVCMMLLPATAHADMQGVDMSNWQCGADVYNMQADFVVVGTTWGTGQVNNNCLVSGVNTDANRMIAQAQASGKKFGLYHYAMGGNPEAEAQFFYRNPHGVIGIGCAASWPNVSGFPVVCAHCCTPARWPAPSRRTSATGTACGLHNTPT